MYEGNQRDEENGPVTLDEQYGIAVTASNLRVHDHKLGAVDFIIAAGMNCSRLGMALRRLRTEWDKSAKPRPMPPAALDALAGTYPRLASGMVLFKQDGQEVEVKPAEAARMDADHWMQNELRILLISLRTLPTVRAAVIHHAAQMGIEDGEHAAGSAILWWLDPTCAKCGGGGKQVTAGTGRQSAKDCKPCRGSGERNIPHGAVGRKLLKYIRSTLGHAAADLKGRFRHPMIRS